MSNHSEWHDDQNLAAQKNLEEKANKIAEREEILNSYTWIKVPKYYEIDPNKEDVDWKVEYQKLIQHHKLETEFLITKIRGLVK